MSGGARTGERRSGRLIAAVLGAAGLVFVLANAHLVYVATSSQPDCVAHAGQADKDGHRAAKPAC